MGMEFLYFPEDKSEYIPGILSILVIILVSGIIFRLLVRASKKEVDKLEQQGFNASSNYNPDAPASEPHMPEDQSPKATNNSEQPPRE